MKQLPRAAELEIFAAQAALDKCLMHPEKALRNIKKAQRSVQQAADWIELKTQNEQRSKL